MPHEPLDDKHAQLRGLVMRIITDRAKEEELDLAPAIAGGITDLLLELATRFWLNERLLDGTWLDDRRTIYIQIPEWIPVERDGEMEKLFKTVVHDAAFAATSRVVARVFVERAALEMLRFLPEAGPGPGSGGLH